MSEPELTVTVIAGSRLVATGAALSVTAPVPTLRLAEPVPRYVKLPRQVCELLPESVRLAVVSSAAPLLIRIAPVPRAASLPSVSVPELSVVWPV